MVTEDFIRREPTRNLVAGHQIDYIVELPWAGHPTGCYGRYETDGDFIRHFFSTTRTQEGLDSWVEEWILGVENFEEYLQKVGVERLETLRANPVFGYSTKVRRGTR